MSTRAIFMAMLPEHLLLLGLVLVLISVIVGRAAQAAWLIALVAVAGAAAAAAWLALQGGSASPFPGQFSVTPATLWVKAMVLALALPVLLMARHEFADATAEFAALLTSSLYGVCLMQSADSFLTLFLGLEIMSLPLYALVLLAWRRPQAAEAALKYLVLSGAATATLLMGASLLYGATGSLALSAFARALASHEAVAQTAAVLIVLAFFLKAAIAPLHGWAPDAYEAASVPVTAYMATIVKAAVLLAAVRLFDKVTLATPMLELLVWLPLLSIVWGNLAAMRQTSLRRLIAYSSIAHAGYLFYAMLGAPEGRLQAVAFYLVAYGVMNLLAFAALPPADDDGQRDRLDQLTGMFQRSPFAALMIGLAMLSLAGIPPLPGFIAKFLIFKNVMAAGHTTYAVLGLVGSFVGIYFYLRVIQLMFMGGTAVPASGPTRRSGALAITASLVCLVAALGLALFPGGLLARW